MAFQGDRAEQSTETLPCCAKVTVCPAYEEQARKLLADEFLWFSLEDVAQVFARHGHSYVPAWHALIDADVNGAKAVSPIKLLPRPRDSQPACGEAGSARLQSELEALEAWRQKEEREFQLWANSLFFSRDVDGKEQLLDVDGKQVMMEWEKPYMQRCVEALGIGPDSHVLEVGFGCGYSAEWIQRAGPKSHTIIECSDTVLQRLSTWASDKDSVIVVQGTWQEKLPELGTFDCIFFDDYGAPGLADREMELCPRKCYREEYARTMREERGSHFAAFANIIFQWHSRPGTKMSGYLEHPVELAREDLKVEYSKVPVAPPAHCNYFPTDRRLCDQATVPLFTRLGGYSEEDSTEACSRPSSRSGSERDSSSRSRSRSRSRASRQMRNTRDPTLPVAAPAPLSR